MRLCNSFKTIHSKGGWSKKWPTSRDLCKDAQHLIQRRTILHSSLVRHDASSAIDLGPVQQTIRSKVDNLSPGYLGYPMPGPLFPARSIHTQNQRATTPTHQ